jgi:hypothetical protein
VEPFQFFLTDIMAEDYAKNPLSVYMDDFSDRLQKAVSEWRQTYAPEEKSH